MLKGITVIEMAGLAPAPFCGMVLSDFGARVIRIDRPNGPSFDNMGRGKQSMMLNLKHEKGVSVLKKLCKKSDVLLECYRPGVMEKLGMGPEVMVHENPRLVYARLTGYGQKGNMSMKAGHDINYIATSGILSKLGWQGDKPSPPINLLADFAGGGLMCAMGIIMALYERSVSGKGQVVDANMVQGSAYLGSWLDSAKDFVFAKERGTNLLDGGVAFYDTYKTKDGKFMAVGSIEPKFYADLIKGLGLDADKVSQSDDQEEQRRLFQDIFSTKTRAEWTDIFNNLDACVTHVLSTEEASQLPHNKVNNTFVNVARPGHSSMLQAGPAPTLSRTPADVSQPFKLPVVGEHTLDILTEYGFSEQEIKGLASQGVVVQKSKSSL